MKAVHVLLVWLVTALTCMMVVSCSVGEEPRPLAELSLTPYVGRLVTLTTVVHGDTLPFLLDTGGGETLITPSLADRIGCTPAGRSVGFRMTGERVEFSLCRNVTLSLDNLAFHHSDIAVLDIASLLPSDWPHLSGVISLKTFAEQPLTLDLANARLILESEGSLAQRVEDMTALPSRFASGADSRSLTLLMEMVAPAPGWYLFDSANLDVVQVGSHLVDSVSVAETDEIATGLAQIVGLPSIEAEWRVSNIIYDGALSEDFLRAWVFTLDMAADKVWATPVVPREAS